MEWSNKTAIQTVNAVSLRTTSKVHKTRSKSPAHQKYHRERRTLLSFRPRKKLAEAELAVAININRYIHFSVNRSRTLFARWWTGYHHLAPCFQGEESERTWSKPAKRSSQKGGTHCFHPRSSTIIIIYRRRHRRCPSKIETRKKSSISVAPAFPFPPAFPSCEDGTATCRATHCPCRARARASPNTSSSIQVNQREKKKKEESSSSSLPHLVRKQKTKQKMAGKWEHLTDLNRVGSRMDSKTIGKRKTQYQYPCSLITKRESIKPRCASQQNNQNRHEFVENLAFARSSTQPFP